MTPIKFTNSTDSKEVEAVKTTKDDKDWYDYNFKKWANAQTEDGSMWVWIPRYAYRINSSTQTCDVVFLEGTSNFYYYVNGTKQTAKRQDIVNETIDTTTGYMVHPAFTDESKIGFVNGGWDKELTGIWVAKFEMSMEINKVSTVTENNTIGNVLTSDTVRAVSKPGVTSWRNITIGNCYTNARYYGDNLGNKQLNSHLLKNSEWGAVAYLTHSNFGRNKTEVTINNNKLFYTAGEEGKTAINNISQSSTGNKTGIYDLNGCSWEYVASYLSDGVSYLDNGKDANENSFVSTSRNVNGYKILSTKYVTVYPFNVELDNESNNWTQYNSLKSIKYGNGDAILETSNGGNGTTSWNGDFSYYPFKNSPFFIRSGSCNHGTNSGIFAFCRCYWRGYY